MKNGMDGLNRMWGDRKTFPANISKEELDMIGHAALFSSRVAQIEHQVVLEEYNRANRTNRVTWGSPVVLEVREEDQALRHHIYLSMPLQEQRGVKYASMPGSPASQREFVRNLPKLNRALVPYKPLPEDIVRIHAFPSEVASSLCVDKRSFGLEIEGSLQVDGGTWVRVPAFMVVNPRLNVADMIMGTDEGITVSGYVRIE